MILNCYSVYDTASKMYDRPFFAQADGMALRSFGDIAVNAEHPIGQHPEDYSLFKIGVWDDNKGKLEGMAPECLATALEMVAQARQINPANLRAVDDKLNGDSDAQSA